MELIYEMKIGFLPSIETLRRVFNWSLHPNIEDEIFQNKNPIFIHSKALDLQDSRFQSRSTLPHEV